MTFEKLKQNINELNLPLDWEHLTITSLYKSISSASVILSIKIYLSFYKNLIHAIGKHRIDLNTNYIFTYSNSLAYNRDLVMGPAKEMVQHHPIAIIGLKPNLSIPSEVEGMPFYSVNDIKSIAYINIPEIIYLIICLNIKVWFCNSKFDLKERLEVVAFLQLRYLNYFRFYYFINNSNVKGVITDYDRHHVWSTLILASNIIGVRTFTHIHGLIYKGMEFGFTPIISDFAFCWGKKHKEELIQLGESKDCLVITGNPRFNVERINNNENSKYYTIVLNPSQSDLKQLIKKLTLLAEYNNKKLAIKLHPSQRAADFQNYIDSGVEVWEYNTIANRDVIKNTELFFVISSGYAYDLCFYTKPIFILSCCGYIGSNRDLIEFKAAIEIDNLDLLADRIKKLEEDGRREELYLNMQNISKYYIAVGGIQASRNIKNVIVNNT